MIHIQSELMHFLAFLHYFIFIPRSDALFNAINEKLADGGVNDPHIYGRIWKSGCERLGLELKNPIAMAANQLKLFRSMSVNETVSVKGVHYKRNSYSHRLNEKLLKIQSFSVIMCLS